MLSLLTSTYGRLPRRPPSDPLDEMIGTILSQHTSDTNSGKAFASLKACFPSWAELLRAPHETIAEAIRSGGLATTKARYIKSCLAELERRRGELSLRYLDALPTAEAIAELVSLPGVGAKTAACVLLFSLGRAVIPVDTHVHRVARRLGLAPADATPEDVEAALEAQFADDPTTCYHLHVHLVTHGRQVCHARNPACDRCFLARHCAHIASQPASAASPA